MKNKDYNKWWDAILPYPPTSTTVYHKKCYLKFFLDYFTSYLYLNFNLFHNSDIYIYIYLYIPGPTGYPDGGNGLG